MDRIPAEIFTKCCAVQAEGIRQTVQLAAASMGTGICVLMFCCFAHHAIRRLRPMSRFWAVAEK